MVLGGNVIVGFLMASLFMAKMSLNSYIVNSRENPDVPKYYSSMIIGAVFVGLIMIVGEISPSISSLTPCWVPLLSKLWGPMFMFSYYISLTFLDWQMLYQNSHRTFDAAEMNKSLRKNKNDKNKKQKKTFCSSVSSCWKGMFSWTNKIDLGCCVGSMKRLGNHNLKQARNPRTPSSVKRVSKGIVYLVSLVGLITCVIGLGTVDLLDSSIMAVDTTVCNMDKLVGLVAFNVTVFSIITMFVLWLQFSISGAKAGFFKNTSLICFWSFGTLGVHLWLSFSPAHRAWFEMYIYDPSVIETLFALGPIILNVFLPFIASSYFGWERVSRATCNCYPTEVDGHELGDDEFTTVIDMTTGKREDGAHRSETDEVFFGDPEPNTPLKGYGADEGNGSGGETSSNPFSDD